MRIKLSNLPPRWSGNWTDEESRRSCILNLAPVLRRRRRREAGASVRVVMGGWGERSGEGLARHNFGTHEVLWGPEPSLMRSRQPLWHAAHVDLVSPDRKPPCSRWRESRFSRLRIYNVAYSSYTSHFEHNYTIASKARNLSFIKVITVCLPYGPIVFHVLTSVWTVRERALSALSKSD